MFFHFYFASENSFSKHLKYRLERRSRFSRKRCKERAFYPILPNKKRIKKRIKNTETTYLPNTKDITTKIKSQRNKKVSNSNICLLTSLNK
jgi:hypothetical protein